MAAAAVVAPAAVSAPAPAAAPAMNVRLELPVPAIRCPFVTAGNSAVRRRSIGAPRPARKARKYPGALWRERVTPAPAVRTLTPRHGKKEPVHAE
ncbi:hypothetical protein Sxan_37500 [Streptomyces xanthophaeus]|uniref:Secreted protein n=1 Tax=Streptomyces xanthophaeus TaxID=67385 RepID=A0A919GXA5_9ACTN|nr:hypothetical protein Sxan_37500 [Streptomyces xanthophaeus]